LKHGSNEAAANQLKIMKVSIELVNYFGHSDDINFNAKVLYKKNRKQYLAHIYIDFFNRRIYIPKQAKECKILKGFEQAINRNQGFEF
jgi:hypothetical protein